jgi:hypothetical protein
MTTGTAWTAPGRGATRNEFAGALGRYNAMHPGALPVAILRDLQKRIPPKKRTNLALTGRDLEPVDLERIGSKELKVSR